MKILALLAFLLIAGCNEQKFSTNTPPVTPVKPASQESYDISTNTLTRANPTQKGSGVVTVRTAGNAEITCLDCPAEYALSFAAPSTSDSTIDRAANFSYPFVSDTQICPVHLKVRYASGKTETINYALYFCPVDLSLQVSKCDKAAARRVCNI